jgi:histidyl-tRNA synthetase
LYRAVEATRDILPGEIERWQVVENAARELFQRYGFREVRTPVFEFTELFTRSVGEGTDIVAKEMYTFTDRGKRSLTLRPEGTAPAARAYVEHQVHRREEISRWYYCGPMFRYERKQRGRYRQFSQIGAEVFGSSSPAVDAETIEMVMRFLDHLEVSRTTLHLNSLGCVNCRPTFLTELRRRVEPDIADYCENCQRRVQENILRVLDCKEDARKVSALPSILDYLCAGCQTHFAAVREALEDVAIPYRLAPHLVRGLDYYTRTAFEVTAEGLGAQNAVLGGGRYDDLVASLGGPAIPAFGFAVGLDRLILLLPEGAGRPKPASLLVIAVGEPARRQARILASRLRAGGLAVDLSHEEKSVKAQMRRADKAGIPFALILGEDEMTQGRLTVRRLEDGQQLSYAAEDTGRLIEDIAHAGT